MDKSRKFALKFLKFLERIFPEDMISTTRWDDFGEYNQKVVQTLMDNGLIEIKKYGSSLRNKEGEEIPVGAYKITSKGIEFLNGLKQKSTNRWIMALTIILTLIGIIQIIISLVK